MYPKPKMIVERVDDGIEIYLEGYKPYLGLVFVHMRQTTHSQEEAGLIYNMAIQPGAHDFVSPEWVEEFQDCIDLGVKIAKREILIKELMPEYI